MSEAFKLPNSDSVHLGSSPSETVQTALHVCPRHDFAIVDDARQGCPQCNALKKLSELSDEIGQEL